MKWISILVSSKQMVREYKTSVVKMNDDVVSNEAINNNYELETNMCATYVGSNVEFKQACLKQGHFHIQFCFGYEVVSI